MRTTHRIQLRESRHVPGWRAWGTAIIIFKRC
jgi:hypothetical protein